MRVPMVLQQLRTKQFMRKAGIVAGVLVVFGLGVAVGNGHIRLVPRSNYSSQTGLPATLDYSSLNQLYDSLRQNYDGKLTEQQVLDGLKHGLANAAGDPYTEYFTPAEAKDFNGQLEGMSVSGIGALLDQDSEGHVVVMSPLEGSPASEAGLQAKDIIVTIDGQSTAGMSVNEAVKKIRGPKGSQVKLVIMRGEEQLTFTITRATVTVPNATSKVLDGNVGYIQISQFSTDTYTLVQDAVTSFKQEGVTKLVLDLRDDPGGEVDSAQDVASLWLARDALIMQERRGSKVIDEYRASGVNNFKGMPTVVLVNAGSASASEIVALALRDHKAATIIGEKSYGKGVVQQVIPFSDGSELKVTIAKWYSPNGTNVSHKGITPDQTVAAGDRTSTPSAASADAGTDPQLHAALDYLQKH